MKNKLPNISESEWLIMNKLWEKSPVTAAEIVEKVQRKRDLEVTTIKTLLLIAKKAVSFTDEKNSKLYYYFPIVEQQDCVLEESRQFLSLYYENDLNKLFANFLEDAELSGPLPFAQTGLSSMTTMLRIFKLPCLT